MRIPLLKVKPQVQGGFAIEMRGRLYAQSGLNPVGSIEDIHPPSLDLKSFTGYLRP